MKTAFLPLVATVAAIANANAASVAISLDFLGDSQISTLSSTDVAGVVPAVNWNNLPGNSGAGVAAIDDTGTTGVLVSYSANFSDTIMGNTGSTNDEVIMNGWLGGSIATSTSPNWVEVRVTGINLADLGWASYDIIAYSNTGAPYNPSGLRAYNQLVGLTTLDHFESIPAYGAPGYTGYIDGTGGIEGNYVRFTGLTSSDFTLRTRANNGIDDSQFVGLNALQIVERQMVPEPSTAVLGAIGAIGLIIRRRR